LFEDEDSEPKRKAYKVEISEVPDLDGNGATDLTDVQLLLKSSEHNVKAELKQNGSFDSPESIELLKEADIVVTNPPFSLFREFLALLDKYNKQFIIIGNTNALTYKETFKMFQEDKIRTGYTNFNVGMYFQVPDSWEKFHHVENGKKMARVSTSCWFTNLPVSKHNEELILIKHYTPEEYPKYDNYDAINVNTYTDIPCDFDGVMGVPVTFLDKYNPKQFEIIGITKTWFGGACKIYPEQIQIDKSGKKSKVSKLNDGPAIQVEDISRYTTYYIVDGKKYIQTYARILIRNKKPQTI
jgi:hypothetical protein